MTTYLHLLINISKSFSTHLSHSQSLPMLKTKMAIKILFLIAIAAFAGAVVNGRSIPVQKSAADVQTAFYHFHFPPYGSHFGGFGGGGAGTGFGGVGAGFSGSPGGAGAGLGAGGFDSGTGSNFGGGDGSDGIGSLKGGANANAGDANASAGGASGGALGDGNEGGMIP